MTDDMAGRLLDGRYRLRVPLGAGGMGEVWRAHDELLDREVALKLIHPAAAQDAHFRARFEREASFTARLAGDPHIVTVYDFRKDPCYHVVMELVEGSSLDTLVRDGAPPPLTDVLAWARQICAALHTAHAKEIVHRDLKPSNVILTRAGNVKVVDFGIAALMPGAAPGSRGQTKLTVSGHFLGSPPYASPEQIRGMAVDARADLYSLGCLLYELVTGAPPFGTGSIHSVVDRHLREPPPPPTELRPDLPLGLERLILDLLAKDREARPPDAAAVLRRLRPLETPRGYTPTSADPLAAAAAPRPPGGGTSSATALHLARVFDFRGPDGAPAIAPDREHVTSAEECAALLRSLRQAPVALHGLVPEPDRLDPDRNRVVPAGFRTDGLWVWSDQIAYYLERYRCAPDPALRHHLARRAEERPDVPARLLSAAGKLVRGEPQGSLTGRPVAGAG
ncbi:MULTISPECIES: serine/threonine-protein kinase [unclassified Streptomyces]|uniref:serine/threonine-protein kinase n=1 Tax=unclassified Streptomyces TaxID=2593676 RepID=UPI00068C9601|nr:MULTISPECIES: serine/threonine-protein kinase [unclassified Streptomyces]